MRRPAVLSLASLFCAGLTLLCLGACSDKAQTAVAPAAAQTASPAAPLTGGPGSSAGAPGATPSAPAAAPAGPPVTITTARALIRDFPVYIKATGTVAPLSNVEVRPQMSSVISKVHFKEGQFVRAGELLFTLDARADEANVAKAMAQLARDQASLADAQRQLARSKQLLAQNFVSQGAVDTSQAQVDAQTALVATDKAAIDAARVPLSYARIVAPSAGRAGSVVVFPGSAVIANQTTLVTITQLDPIAVAFNLPQRYLQDVLGLQAGGGAQVTATLPESGEKLIGKLQFVDNLVDANSGTVKVKAVFENKAGKLWPGAFAEVALLVQTIKDAVVVPQASVIETARGPIIYAVEDGKAALKSVKVITSQGTEAIVSGVKPGSVVILDGRQSVRPGSAVVERTREPGQGGQGGPGGARKGASKEGEGSKDATDKKGATDKKDGAKS